MLLQPHVLPVNKSAKGCFICPHVEKDQHMYLIYAEVNLRYHKVNTYKFEGDSEMFDLWLSECAKYNAMISITAN